MRDLTAQQKKLLKAWFRGYYHGGCMFGLADKMYDKLYQEIEDLHPTEIHYQNVNHFLEDLASNWNIKKQLDKN